MGVDSEDGSSDDNVGGSSSNGLKAVTDLHKMQKRITTASREICESFEAEAIERLGVTPGQAWTLADWLKSHKWGRFKGMYRCALMDIAAYQMIRRKEYQAAAAQLAQNCKAKVQMVSQNGDWTAAWLLTGLRDPLDEEGGGASKSEMAVIAGYLKATTKLKKLVAETEKKGDQQKEDG